MTQLKLDGAAATMMKISTNVLAKDADNTIFTLPLEGIELTREELNATLGERTFEAWYDQRKDGSYHPMPFFATRKDKSFEIDEEFVCAGATIGLSGDKEIEFETIEAEDDGKDSEDQAAAKVTCLKFTPTAGGITRLSLHVQVRPGLGKDNLALQQHQYRPVTITLDQITAKPRKGAQQDLPLTSAGPAPATTGDQPPAAAGNGDGFADGARRQVEAFNAKKGEVVDGRSERVRHQDRTRSGPKGAH